MKTLNSKARKAEFDLEHEKWKVEGRLLHSFDEADLTQVSEKLKRAGLVANGYSYPELHRIKGMPAELASSLKSKAAAQRIEQE